MIERLCIDPGHGGSDPGARHNGIIESRLNLDVALTVAGIVRAAFPHIHIVMTRHDNDTTVSLRDRGIIVRDKCDFVLSIHTNAAESDTLRWVRTFHYPGSSAARVCSDIQKYYPEQLRTKLDPISTGTDSWTSRAHAVVSAYKQPVCLVELGFCTNKYDAEYMKTEDGQAMMAMGIARGLAESISKQ